MASQSVRYYEVQRTRPWWLVLIILLPTVITWLGALQQLVLGEPLGSDPVSDTVMVAMVLTIGIVLPLLLLNIHLTVIVTDRISIRFFPFMPRPRIVRPEQIKRSQATRYDPLLDYGGWGIRGWSMDRAYNVKGDSAVRLWLSDGRTILIGSQRPEELNTAIEAMLSGGRTEDR
ncbi:MAG: DUF6141 family protein [Methanomassiliicoccales archaeon]|nr:DUF6141 family protein [Methanomassiliicoccales archaeon]